MKTNHLIQLDDLSPDHPARHVPFTAPDGYFDALPTRIQTRVAEAHKPAFTISWSWQRTVASLAGASLVAALIYVTLPQRQESLGTEALAGVSNTDIVAYLDDQGLITGELADQEAIQAAFPQDSTMIQYLDVKPGAVQQVLDEQNTDDLLNIGS
jgi:hypothetical protein